MKEEESGVNYAEESLRLHGEWKGKIEVISRVPVKSKDDLSLAYTPGVAQPCLEIQKDIDKSYELTRRRNMSAVITDGTAVLGLGDIKPEAGMPVSGGQCVLFKSFGDVDAFPLCVKSKDMLTGSSTPWRISGSFGGGIWRTSPRRAALRKPGRTQQHKRPTYRSSTTTSTPPRSSRWRT